MRFKLLTAEIAVPLGTKARRVAWLLLEVAVACGIVAGIYYWATEKPNSEFPLKWVGFFTGTIILFGYQIYWSGDERKSIKFWRWWSICLSLHLIVIGTLVRRMSTPPLIVFVILTMGEAALITPIFVKLSMYDPPQRPK